MNSLAEIVAVLVASLFVPLTMIALAPAAYAAAGPTSLTIEGPGLIEPLNVVAAADPELFADLLGEVSWLSGKAANAPQPDPATVGPAYTIVIRVDAVADQAYLLYPLAKGGPRLFRPAEQPNNKKVPAAWFYGRISMPDTLRLAGVPLPIADDGGQGGGGPVGAGIVTRSPRDGALDDMVGEWRRQVLVIGAGAVVLLALLGGFVRLARRR